MLARTIQPLSVHKVICQTSIYALEELSISAPHFNKGGATLGKMPSLAIISAITVKHSWKYSDLDSLQPLLPMY
jgi:hypothetical protein